MPINEVNKTTQTKSPSSIPSTQADLDSELLNLLGTASTSMASNVPSTAIHTTSEVNNNTAISLFSQIMLNSLSGGGIGITSAPLDEDLIKKILADPNGATAIDTANDLNYDINLKVPVNINGTVYQISLKGIARTLVNTRFSKFIALRDGYTVEDIDIDLAIANPNSAFVKGLCKNIDFGDDLNQYVDPRHKQDLLDYIRGVDPNHSGLDTILALGITKRDDYLDKITDDMTGDIALVTAIVEDPPNSGNFFAPNANTRFARGLAQNPELFHKLSDLDRDNLLSLAAKELSTTKFAANLAKNLSLYDNINVNAIINVLQIVEDNLDSDFTQAVLKNPGFIDGVVLLDRTKLTEIKTIAFANPDSKFAIGLASNMHTNSFGASDFFDPLQFPEFNDSDSVAGIISVRDFARDVGIDTDFAATLAGRDDYGIKVTLIDGGGKPVEEVTIISDDDKAAVRSGLGPDSKFAKVLARKKEYAGYFVSGHFDSTTNTGDADYFYKGVIDPNDKDTIRNVSPDSELAVILASRYDYADWIEEINLGPPHEFIKHTNELEDADYNAVRESATTSGNSRTRFAATIANRKGYEITVADIETILKHGPTDFAKNLIKRSDYKVFDSKNPDVIKLNKAIAYDLTTAFAGDEKAEEIIKTLISKKDYTVEGDDRKFVRGDTVNIIIGGTSYTYTGNPHSVFAGAITLKKDYIIKDDLYLDKEAIKNFSALDSDFARNLIKNKDFKLDHYNDADLTNRDRLADRDLVDYAQQFRIDNSSSLSPPDDATTEEKDHWKDVAINFLVIKDSYPLEKNGIDDIDRTWARAHLDQRHSQFLINHKNYARETPVNGIPVRHFDEVDKKKARENPLSKFAIALVKQKAYLVNVKGPPNNSRPKEVNGKVIREVEKEDIEAIRDNAPPTAGIGNDKFEFAETLAKLKTGLFGDDKDAQGHAKNESIREFIRGNDANHPGKKHGVKTRFAALVAKRRDYTTTRPITINGHPASVKEVEDDDRKFARLNPTSAFAKEIVKRKDYANVYEISGKLIRAISEVDRATIIASPDNANSDFAANLARRKDFIVRIQGAPAPGNGGVIRGGTVIRDFKDPIWNADKTFVRGGASHDGPGTNTLFAKYLVQIPDYLPFVTQPNGSKKRQLEKIIIDLGPPPIEDIPDADTLLYTDPTDGSYTNATSLFAEGLASRKDYPYLQVIKTISPSPFSDAPPLELTSKDLARLAPVSQFAKLIALKPGYKITSEDLDVVRLDPTTVFAIVIISRLLGPLSGRKPKKGQKADQLP